MNLPFNRGGHAAIGRERSRRPYKLKALTGNRIASSLAWPLVVFGAMGCTASGAIRGSASVAAAARSCPEVTSLVNDVQTNWAASFGIDSGDAATLKAALSATAEFEKHAASTDEKLKTICSKLASDLGAPIAATNGEEACRGASEATSQAKTQLGAQANVTAPSSTECKPDCSTPCDPSAPQGPCAQAKLTVNVSGASDPELAERYSLALQTALPALLEIVEAESDSRALVYSAKTAIELGLTTGKAVSEGDVASAVATALCILPPLYEAKKRLDSLQAEMHLLRTIAKNAGKDLPKPTRTEAPVATHTTLDEGSLPNVAAPMNQRITQLYSFPDGGFAAQTREAVVGLPGGEVILNVDAHIPNSISGKLYCAVGRQHRVACIRDVKILQKGKLVGTQLVLFDSAMGHRAVESVDSRGFIEADGIVFDAAGTLHYAYSLTRTVGNQTFQSSQIVRGNQQMLLPFRPEHGSLEEIGGGDRGDPPIQFFEFRSRMHILYRDGRTLLLAPLDRPGAAVQVAERTAYDSRAIVGGDGILYVFYHEPKSRTFRVARSSDVRTFQDLVLDTRESGWQLEAIPTVDGAMAVYYYYRDSYNKGLRVVALRGGSLARPRNTILLEKHWNAGWHPHLVCDRGREIWLTYLSNVESATRVWSHFKQPSELFDYGVIVEKDDYKNWFVQVGAGAWYTFWTLHSPAPDSKAIDGAHLNAARYHVDPTLLLSANLEARFGPVDLGLSYAQNYLDKAAKNFGDASRLMSGNVKIADLLPGHDLKVEGLWGHYHGRMERTLDAGGGDEATLDTNYVDVHLYALNQWRIKYGLAFTHYALPTPIQAYSAPAKQAHYAFVSSEIRNVQYNDVDLAIGYSMLDYVAKYENSYFGPIADVALEVGAALSSFNAITTPAGNVTSAIGLHLRGALQLGWLWMNRFESLAKLGIYVRPFYAIEGGWSGASRPKDRETKDANSDSTAASFQLESLRHGPWLDMGIVW